MADLVAPLQRTADHLPSFHCVWHGLFDVVAATPSIVFASVWSVLVEKALFGPESTTHERKALGFRILQEFLPKLKADQVL